MQMVFLGNNHRNSSKLTDDELISRYCSTGHKELIGILYKRYTRFVFLICMKYLKDRAKDAVMQVFENLFTDLLKHEVKSFKSWLYTVTKNHCFMQLREEKQDQQRSIRMKMDQSADMESDPFLHPNEEKEQAMVKLQGAVNNLREEQRRCIEMFYFEKKCYSEIAEITGFTVKQVKSHLQNGKRNLRIMLEERHG